MIIIPSIDVLDGSVVKLVQGKVGTGLKIDKSPEDLVKEFADKGFKRVHIVDLSRAFGKKSEETTYRHLPSKFPQMDFQIGGGIRNTEEIRKVLSWGFKSVIVGTRALLDMEWAERAARTFPLRLMLAVEVEGESVMVSGWKRKAPLTLDEVLTFASKAEFSGLLVTDISREGKLEGANTALVQRIRKKYTQAIHYSGGIRDKEDLKKLEDAGADACIVGMAIYKFKFEDLASNP